MSALSDALKGIKQLLTLQLQVEALEEGGKTQRNDLKGVATDLITLDKRVVRIETMIEMTNRRGSQPPLLPADGA